MAEEPSSPARNFPGQLKGWFADQAAKRVPPSAHVTHGERENEQLAEIIGQLQHVLDLAGTVPQVGRPSYPPQVVTLDALTTVDLLLPAGPLCIDALQVSSDTAFTLTAALLDKTRPGGSLVVARVVVPVGVAPVLPLFVDVPPAPCVLRFTASVAPAACALHVLLRPTLPGGYPYVG